MPDSLEGGGCDHGSTLTLDIDPSGTKLIGRPRGQGPSCVGAQLIGAAFTVRSPWQEQQLMIANVVQFEENGPHEGYLITDSHGAHLCQFGGSRIVYRHLGYTNEVPDNEPRIVPDGFKPGEYDDFAIAMKGPVFDENTAKPVTGITQANFFNLACVGDALAKTSFYNLGGDNDKTSAALRMFTANYCGQRMTIRGMPIEFFAPHNGSSQPVLEAEWGTSGALCIEQPRLMNLQVGGQPFRPEQLPASLQPEGCKSEHGGKCDPKEWIDHLQKQCHISQSCPPSPPNPPKPKDLLPPVPVMLTSEVEPNGELHVNKVIEHRP